MSFLLPQVKCSQEYSVHLKFYSHISSQFTKYREPKFLRTRCILSTIAPPVPTKFTVLNLEKLQLSSLEDQLKGASCTPWLFSTAGVFDIEKFPLPSLEAHINSVVQGRPWTCTSAIYRPLEGDFEATFPSAFLTSEESVIEAAAAEAVNLAKAALKVAKDAKALIINYSSFTPLDMNAPHFLSKFDYFRNEIASNNLVMPLDEVEPTNEELKLLQGQPLDRIAVRSNRQMERKARRRKTAERAATRVFSVKSGSMRQKKRGSLPDVDYSDQLRYFRGSTCSKLLTATEETELSRGIQEVLKLEKLHDELTKCCGSPPSVVQWAAAAGVDRKTLRERLNYGAFCREKMMKSNIRLVISIAKSYQRAGMKLEDLVQEGCRGLIVGAEKFDASKGFKFSTYAHWWIKQSMQKSLSDQTRTIRLPFHVVDATYRVKMARKQLYNENGKQPNDEQVAKATGISMKRLRTILLIPKEPRSLDQKHGIFDQNLKASDVTPHPEAKTPEDILVMQYMKQDLDEVLNTLRPREKQVVRWRFGLEDGRMKTLQEIGESWGVSRERIRQIESCALRKLKTKRKIQHLHQYLLS